MNPSPSQRDIWPPSSKPFRSNPPDGTVGIAIPVREGLKFFKLTFYSLIDFTDWRHMLTIVDSMAGFHIRNHLDSIKRNHNVNVLQYQNDANLAAEANLAFRFMFAFKTVRFGILIQPQVVVEPFWVSHLLRSFKADEHLGIIAPALAPTVASQILNRDAMIERGGVISPLCFAFRREVFELNNGFNEAMLTPEDAVRDFCIRAESERFTYGINPRVCVHHFDLAERYERMAV